MARESNFVNGVFEAKSSQPVLSFAYNFRWKSEDSGSGTGKFVATSRNLEVRVTLKDGNLTNDIAADFHFELKSITGRATNAMKKYITRIMSEEISKNLKNVIQSDKNIVIKYLFSQYKSKYNVYNGVPLELENTPDAWELRAQRVIVLFKTKLKAGNVTLEVENPFLPGSSEERGILVSVNQEFIFLAFKAMHKINNLSTKLDLQFLGYTGTIKDFYKIDPTLKDKYPPHSIVDAFCHADNFTYYVPRLSVNVTFLCRFYVNKSQGETNQFARMKGNAMLRLRRTTTNDTEKLFTAVGVEMPFKVTETRPSNDNTMQLMTEIVGRIKNRVILNGMLDIPRVRYESLRMYKEMSMNPQSDRFDVLYTF
eukprot:TRINITY_DN6065_c0_g1_i1.p1 TRINITY_DN6065_c0_g1~~TRINITY_DN6065_c0_g1_i1.p1  ORF type:complete len:379 (+),score=96.11 TRINITY_DN6065_c0_g1_i1:34-1137(+)